MIWSILYHFPQYNLDDVLKMSGGHIGFLLGGFSKYHVGKKVGK